MRFNPTVFDVWVFRRAPSCIEFLVLHTSPGKADRHFGGGRYWQIPSGVFQDGERVPTAVDRELTPYQLRATGIWAAEHAYTIFNRRFDEVQIVTVFAAEVEYRAAASVALNPEEHSEWQWLPFEQALSRVTYRGLKDGLRSTNEYVTGTQHPAPELRLR